MNRSKEIGILARIWIGAGVVLVVTAFMNGCAMAILKSVTEMTGLFFGWDKFLPIAQAILGFLIAWSGIGLFARQRWARMSLEIVCWVGLISAIIYGGLLYPSLIYHNLLWSTGGWIGLWLLTMAVLTGTMTVTSVGLLLVMLKLLRGEAVRHTLVNSEIV